jgi:hypothetical protein
MLIHALAIVYMGTLSSMIFYRKYVCRSNEKIEEKIMIHGTRKEE